MDIAITGATGNMLKPAVSMILGIDKDIKVRILTRNPNTNTVKKWKREFGERISVIKGDVSDKSCLKDLIIGVKYIIHAAAIIPPQSDSNHILSHNVNYQGTVNMVDTIKEVNPDVSLIHISTVAVYGNRNYKHPWGRVGDPLLPSPFDVYGSDKLKAERYVVESGLSRWSVIRQTGMLYTNILMNNISDGLMFHTPLNVPIEWATDIESATLIKNILIQDINNQCEDFWKKIYNLGGGDDERVTGFETFDIGFSLMGGNAKKFIKPNWHATRNFHCFWFYDSDVLEDKFHFRSESVKSFFDRALKANQFISLGRIAPSFLIRKFVFDPILKDKNAPMYWIEHGEDEKVKASFGSREEALSISESWDKFYLLCENKNPDTGEFLDYNLLKDKKTAKLLSHGWDEDLQHLSINKIKEAGNYRGLELLSLDYEDLYKPLEWRCKSTDKYFKMSAFGLLFAGYGSPYNADGNPWYENLLNKYPFYNNLWQDSHKESERNSFYSI